MFDQHKKSIYTQKYLHINELTLHSTITHCYIVVVVGSSWLFFFICWYVKCSWCFHDFLFSFLENVFECIVAVLVYIFFSGFHILIANSIGKETRGLNSKDYQRINVCFQHKHTHRIEEGVWLKQLPCHSSSLFSISSGHSYIQQLFCRVLSIKLLLFVSHLI